MAIKIEPDALGRELVQRHRKNKKLIRKAAKLGAHRSRARLVKRTPVDTGQMKNGWRVIEHAITRNDLVTISNDAPHAGIIEVGARPHRVSKAGKLAIMRWAMRKFGIDSVTAYAIATRVAWKLRKHGQKGQYIVRDLMDKIQADFRREYVKLLRQTRRVKAKDMK